jgi:hypothetical protein
MTTQPSKKLEEFAEEQRHFEKRLVAAGYRTSGSPPTPARSDIAATKQTLSIDSVMVEEYSGMYRDFLESSFYLPIQVLKNDRFKIEPIKVTSGAEFMKFMQSEEHRKFSIRFEGCNIDMIANAKQVGVSARQVIDTGEKILVVKLWYGRI